MSLEIVKNYKMIKSEDLNHHGTLFAGRCAEWFIEAAFIAAGSRLNPKHIVCLKVHGLEFLHPMCLGNILGFESRIVHAGKTSFTVYTEVHEIKDREIIRLDGFVTFCYLNESSRPSPHNLILKYDTERELRLKKRAEELVSRK